jgi:hypothetical protein
LTNDRGAVVAKKRVFLVAGVIAGAAIGVTLAMRARTAALREASDDWMDAVRDAAERAKGIVPEDELDEEVLDLRDYDELADESIGDGEESDGQ